MAANTTTATGTTNTATTATTDHQRRIQELATPLIGQTISTLDWSKAAFNYPQMVKIHSYGDGSCFFHSVINSYYNPYKLGLADGFPLDRQQFIRNLRTDLAIKLAEPIDSTDELSPTYYDSLSRGELAEYARKVKNITDCKYSLENMQQELRGFQAVDHVYYEFISNILNKDIYVLDAADGDIRMLGDEELFYKKRDSIVLLFSPGHYDLVGILNDDNSVSTLFKTDNPFITAINERRQQLLTLGSHINQLPVIAATDG